MQTKKLPVVWPSDLAKNQLEADVKMAKHLGQGASGLGAALKQAYSLLVETQLHRLHIGSFFSLLSATQNPRAQLCSISI
jgi:hypothetical protein